MGMLGDALLKRRLGWLGHVERKDERAGKGSVGRGSWLSTARQTEENMDEKYGGGVKQVSTVRGAGAK